jgi:hypothetical protein
MMYRATYRSKHGTERRMTFRCDQGIRQAHRFAQAWELTDDTLQRVEWVRECERPLFELQMEAV